MSRTILSETVGAWAPCIEATSRFWSVGHRPMYWSLSRASAASVAPRSSTPGCEHSKTPGYPAGSQWRTRSQPMSDGRGSDERRPANVCDVLPRLLPSRVSVSPALRENGDGLRASVERLPCAAGGVALERHARGDHRVRRAVAPRHLHGSRGSHLRDQRGEACQL